MSKLSKLRIACTEVERRITVQMQTEGGVYYRARLSDAAIRQLASAPVEFYEALRDLVSFADKKGIDLHEAAQYRIERDENGFVRAVDEDAEFREGLYGFSVGQVVVVDLIVDEQTNCREYEVVGLPPVELNEAGEDQNYGLLIVRNRETRRKAKVSVDLLESD